MTYKYDIAAYCDIGGRERNEDSFLYKITDDACIVALADGLGGHGKGDVASQLVCALAVGMLEKENLNSWNARQIYDACQEALLEKQQEQNAAGQMRTTLNLLTVTPESIHWNHIGDSRTYLFKGGRVERRTFDHSVPQMMVAMGEIQEKDIRFHEDRNRLLKVLGVEGFEPVCEEETILKPEADMCFLLCSDGFWELINEEQMELCLQDADDAQFWLDNMIELVHRNGRGKDTDNTTAVCVWIRGE